MRKRYGDTTQQAVANIVHEYEQWVIQVIERRKKADGETIRYLEELRQRIEQLMASLGEVA